MKTNKFMRFLTIVISCVLFYVDSYAATTITYTSREYAITVYKKFGNAVVLSNTFDESTKTGTITFDRDVTEIPNNTFSNTEITSINIPYGVKKIGKEAFKYCKFLKNVTLSYGLDTIGSYAFYGCISLPQININISSVRSVGSYAFAKCENLTEIVVPSSVHKLEAGVFSECYKLTSITIPYELTTIESFVFENCSKLSIVNTNTTYASATAGIVKLPSTVTSIGKQAFYNCRSITSIDIPEGVSTIGERAFGSCTGLTSFTFPKKIKEVSNSVLESCTKLTSVILPDSATSIGDYALSYCSSLESIYIPRKVTMIGENAFANCTSLASIRIPDGVTSVGQRAFEKCTSLKSAYFPASVSGFKNYLFDGCSALTDLYVNWTDYSYFNWNLAFQGMSRQSATLHVPYGTKERYTGYDWSSFKAIVEQPQPLLYTTTDNQKFTSAAVQGKIMCNATIMTHSYADGQWSITFDQNIKEIGYFTGSKVKSITIPDSVVTVLPKAFKGCQYLAGITLPSGVDYIGANAFDGCASLFDIVIPDGVTKIYDYTFSGCTSLEDITLSDKLTSIGSNAFYNCGKLTSITLPSSLKTIANSAFCFCKDLEDITIPKNVTSIGDSAFFGCRSVSDITVEWKTPLSVNSNVFAGMKTHSLITLHVPIGTVEAYKVAAVWKTFKIVEDGLASYRTQAIKALTTKFKKVKVESIRDLITQYIDKIRTASTSTEVDSLHDEALYVGSIAVKFYNEGASSSSVELPSQGTTGHGVRVILEKEGKEDIKLELMNPTRVEFFKK